jgi:hypothetical protein
MKYERFTKKRNGENVIPLINGVCGVDLPKWCISEESDIRSYLSGDAVDRLAELEDKIENGTLVEVVRCKDCVYFQPEFVEMENKERRPYTEEEIKNGKIVSMEQGINCGSRCERYRYWDNNSIPVWFNENDFCSYGKLKAEAEQKLKELEE